MVLLGNINEFTSNVQDKIYEPLLTFGEEKEFLPQDIVMANKEFHITKIVGVLSEIHDTIKNLNILLKHLLNQLHNLYNKNLKEYNMVFKKVLLVEPFDALGSILVIIYFIEKIGCFHLHWYDRCLEWAADCSLERFQNDTFYSQIRNVQVQYKRSIFSIFS